MDSILLALPRLQSALGVEAQMRQCRAIRTLHAQKVAAYVDALRILDRLPTMVAVTL